MENLPQQREFQVEKAINSPDKKVNTQSDLLSFSQSKKTPLKQVHGLKELVQNCSDEQLKEVNLNSLPKFDEFGEKKIQQASPNNSELTFENNSAKENQIPNLNSSPFIPSLDQFFSKEQDFRASKNQQINLQEKSSNQHQSELSERMAEKENIDHQNEIKVKPPVNTFSGQYSNSILGQRLNRGKQDQSGPNLSQGDSQRETQPISFRKITCLLGHECVKINGIPSIYAKSHGVTCMPVKDGGCGQVAQQVYHCEKCQFDLCLDCASSQLQNKTNQSLTDIRNHLQSEIAIQGQQQSNTDLQVNLNSQVKSHENASSKKTVIRITSGKQQQTLQRVLCLQGHECVKFNRVPSSYLAENYDAVKCAYKMQGGCNKKVKRGYHCEICEFDLCFDCAEKQVQVRKQQESAQTVQKESHQEEQKSSKIRKRSQEAQEKETRKYQKSQKKIQLNKKELFDKDQLKTQEPEVAAEQSESVDLLLEASNDCDQNERTQKLLPQKRSRDINSEQNELEDQNDTQNNCSERSQDSSVCSEVQFTLELQSKKKKNNENQIQDSSLTCEHSARKFPLITSQEKQFVIQKLIQGKVNLNEIAKQLGRGYATVCRISRQFKKGLITLDSLESEAQNQLETQPEAIEPQSKDIQQSQIQNKFLTKDPADKLSWKEIKKLLSVYINSSLEVAHNGQPEKGDIHIGKLTKHEQDSSQKDVKMARLKIESLRLGFQGQLGMEIACNKLIDFSKFGPKEKEKYKPDSQLRFVRKIEVWLSSTEQPRDDNCEELNFETTINLIVTANPVIQKDQFGPKAKIAVKEICLLTNEDLKDEASKQYLLVLKSDKKNSKIGLETLTFCWKKLQPVKYSDNLQNGGICLKYGFDFEEPDRIYSVSPFGLKQLVKEPSFTSFSEEVGSVSQLDVKSTQIERKNLFTDESIDYSQYFDDEKMERLAQNALSKSFNDLFDHFSIIESGIDLSKLQKKTLTLEEISNLVKNTTNKEFSEIHLNQILAISKGVYATDQIVLQNGKTELVVDYPGVDGKFSHVTLTYTEYQSRLTKFKTDFRHLIDAFITENYMQPIPQELIFDDWLSEVDKQRFPKLESLLKDQSKIEQKTTLAQAQEEPKQSDIEEMISEISNQDLKLDSKVNLKQSVSKLTDQNLQKVLTKDVMQADLKNKVQVQEESEKEEVSSDMSEDKVDENLIWTATEDDILIQNYELFKEITIKICRFEALACLVQNKTPIQCSNRAKVLDLKKGDKLASKAISERLQNIQLSKKHAQKNDQVQSALDISMQSNQKSEKAIDKLKTLNDSEVEYWEKTSEYQDFIKNDEKIQQNLTNSKQYSELRDHKDKEAKFCKKCTDQKKKGPQMPDKSEGRPQGLESQFEILQTQFQEMQTKIQNIDSFAQKTQMQKQDHGTQNDLTDHDIENYFQKKVGQKYQHILSIFNQDSVQRPWLEDSCEYLFNQITSKFQKQALIESFMHHEMSPEPQSQENQTNVSNLLQQKHQSSQFYYKVIQQLKQNQQKLEDQNILHDQSNEEKLQKFQDDIHQIENAEQSYQNVLRKFLDLPQNKEPEQKTAEKKYTRSHITACQLLVKKLRQDEITSCNVNEMWILHNSLKDKALFKRGTQQRLIENKQELVDIIVKYLNQTEVLFCQSDLNVVIIQ